jgi:L-malate glycosyltransferase
MHIVHVIDSLGRGGAETLLVGVINGMPQHQHTVITLEDRNEFSGELNECTCISLNSPRLSQIPFAALRLKKILRSLKPDIVHSTLYISTIIAKLACPRSIKFIFSLQITQGDEFYEKSKLLYWLDKYTYKKRHIAIAATATVAKDFDKWIGFKNKHFVLYNTFDARYFTPVRKVIGSKETYRVAMVGNLKEQKNYFYLLDALKLLNSPRIACDIYGVGYLETAILQRVKAENLPVVLKGQCRNLWDVLPNYDLYLMCSKREGFGIAAAEAMACGLPALLSDIPVLREVSKGNAVFFDPHKPATLTTAFTDILEGKIDLQKLSDEGTKIVGQYSYSQYLIGLQKIYDEVLITK